MPLAASIRLVCWNPEVAGEHAATLERAGFTVNAEPLSTSRLAGQFAADPPAAIVIDLDRLPSHGRAVGEFLRRAKSTRHIPLVFAGGSQDKVTAIRQTLPDAQFTDWKAAAKAVKAAMKTAPVVPVVPKQRDYQATSLAQKLGLKANLRCALIGAPEAFEEHLDDVPDGVEFLRKLTKDTPLTLWWLRTRAEMEMAADLASVRLPQGANVWFIYPKKAGAIKADFNAYDLRAACLAVGLVDFKICAVDANWTGMKFARKRQ